MQTSRVVPVILVPLLAALTTGCSEPAPTLIPASNLDAGNTLFAAGDPAAALAHYRAAAESEPTSAAAWFGVYMASASLGDTAAAAAALRTATELEPGLGVSGYAHDRSGRAGLPREEEQP
jgi:Flp pilus assembly protein TadD